ncbi:unnamed protein product [Ectocarpus fasciculatus]
MLSSKLAGSALLQNLQETTVISAVPRERAYPVIGTHDGSFHCDEALAVSMLRALPEYKEAHVLRSRKPDELEACDIVVDVGAVYNAEKLRFDHHQREFAGTFEGYNTKLSSAGLVYKHFGRRVIQSILASAGDETVPDSFVDICYDKIYKNFMEHIDAIDNGVSVADGELKYRISSTLSNRVGSLNPSWNEPQTPAVFDERFRDAMMLTFSEFASHVVDLWKVWWPARVFVQQAFDARHTVHPSGKIMVLEQFCPWKDHLFEIEYEVRHHQDAGEILYVLYADSGGSWRIQAVPVDPTSFNSRKKLPEVWCGLRDEVLSEKISFPGAIFIHASGFIGGHKSYEGALHIATQVLLAQ